MQTQQTTDKRASVTPEKITHTAHTLRALIQARWESDLPDKVLEILKKENGKNITTRLVDKMPKESGPWYLIRHYGWTSLGNDAYRRGDYGKDAMEIMLARSEASVPLDAAWVEKENAAYYSARKARNHARMEALNSVDELEAVAQAMNDCEQARAQLIAANARLKKLTQYGSKFSPDEYEIERACGMADAKSTRFINDKYHAAATKALKDWKQQP
jgi:hypothetical protein